MKQLFAAQPRPSAASAEILGIAPEAGPLRTMSISQLLTLSWRLTHSRLEGQPSPGNGTHFEEHHETFTDRRHLSDTPLHSRANAGGRMMPYVVSTTNVSDLALRERIRPLHLAFLDRNMPVLLAAGPKLTDDGTPIGSIYILDIDDRGAAEAFMKEEPYNANGVCSSVSYDKWRKAVFDHVRQPPA